MTTRRFIIRGLAALPALSSVALVSTDPIYAAIEKHKAANRAFIAAVHSADKRDWLSEEEEANAEAASLAASDAETAARYGMHQTVPTTMAGLAAYVAHWDEFLTADTSIGWEAIATIAEAFENLMPVAK